MNLVYVIDKDSSITSLVQECLKEHFPEIGIKIFDGPDFMADDSIDRACLLIVGSIEGSDKGIDIVQKSKCEIPVLFLSDYPYDDYNILPKCFIYDFIPKPVDASLLINRSGLLMKCGYTVRCSRDEKRSLRAEIWNIFDSAPGLYVLLADIKNQQIQLGSSELLNDLEFTLDGIRQQFMMGIFDDADVPLADRYLADVLDQGYAEITAYMRKSNGKRGPLVRWFTIKINSSYNMMLSLGVPILREGHDSSDVVDRMRKLFQNMCANDKKIIEVFKAAAEKADTSKENE